MKAIDATKSIVGTYIGAWETFGFCSDGTIERKSAWKDRIEAKNPVEVDGKAFVQVSSEMTFGDGNKQTFEFTEGYHVNPDGSAGKRYFEVHGQSVTENQLAPGMWAFETQVSSWDFKTFGVNESDVLFAKNTTIKVETGTKEWVSRLTTIQWKNGPKSEQFVSFKGFHDKIE